MQEVIEKLSTLPALFASIPAIGGRKARVNPRQGASLRRASQEGPSLSAIVILCHFMSCIHVVNVVI